MTRAFGVASKLLPFVDDATVRADRPQGAPEPDHQHSRRQALHLNAEVRRCRQPTLAKHHSLIHTADPRTIASTSQVLGPTQALWRPAVACCSDDVGTSWLRDEAPIEQADWKKARLYALGFTVGSVAAPNLLMRDKNSRYKFTAKQVGRHSGGN